MAFVTLVTVVKFNAYFGNEFVEDEELIDSWSRENRYIDLWFEVERQESALAEVSKMKKPASSAVLSSRKWKLCSDQSFQSGLVLDHQGGTL